MLRRTMFLTLLVGLIAAGCTETDNIMSTLAGTGRFDSIVGVGAFNTIQEDASGVLLIR